MFLFSSIRRRSHLNAPAVAPSRYGSPVERHALALKHGYNGMSFLTLYPGWEYFHPTDVEGFIAFERHNRAALACGDPVCFAGDEAAIVQAFPQFPVIRGYDELRGAIDGGFADLRR